LFRGRKKKKEEDVAPQEKEQRLCNAHRDVYGISHHTFSYCISLEQLKMDTFAKHGSSAVRLSIESELITSGLMVSEEFGLCLLDF